MMSRLITAALSAQSSRQQHERRSPGSDSEIGARSHVLSDTWRRVVRKQGSATENTSAHQRTVHHIGAPSNELSDDEDFLGPNWRKGTGTAKAKEPERDGGENISTSPTSARRRARSPVAYVDEEDQPPVKKARAEKRAESQRLLELYGYFNLIMAENQPPPELRPPSPVPIGVKARLALRESQLESISPNTSIHRSTSAQSPTDVAQRPITLLVHSREAGGLVGMRYSNGAPLRDTSLHSATARGHMTSADTREGADDDFDWDGLFEQSQAAVPLQERLEPGSTSDVIVGPSAVPQSEEDDLPDYEDTIDEEGEVEIKDETEASW